MDSQSVSATLRRFVRRPIIRPDLHPSAVALTLVEEPDGPAFLLTRRSTTLRRHAGQWALPGGRIEPGESAAAAARRELSEELGLHLPACAELGELDDYASRSGYLITPVVLWAGNPGDLTPNPDEVGEVHRVPLRHLDVEPRFITIPESDNPVIQVPLFGRFVHAPTGAILHQFREVVLRERDTRVAHFEQPVFAWR